MINDFVNNFGLELTLDFLLISLAYYAFALCPVIWPAIKAYKSSPGFPRPVLFVTTVTLLVYGVMSFIEFTCFVPAAVIKIYIIPQFESNGITYLNWLAHMYNFAQLYSWIVVIPVILTPTLLITNGLQKRWHYICNMPAV